MSRTETVMTVRNLSKTYYVNGQGVRALNQVTFSLSRGEMLAVMGTSGSGKSTLLNILGTLDEPTSGEVLLRGAKPDNMFVEPHAARYRRDHVGFVFQSFQLLKDLSVEENVALPLVLKGLSKKEIAGRTERMLEVVGLTKWRAHRPVELSGGQQQRVAIGRALISSPPVVLADEPTGNLDYNTSADVMSALVGTKERFGQSIVLVTHDPMVAAYADRVVFFHEGSIADEYACTRDRAEDLDRIVAKFKTLLGR